MFRPGRRRFTSEERRARHAESTRRYNAKVPPGERSGKPWTVYERGQVLGAGTSEEIARRLGRTTHAVDQQRYLMRCSDESGKQP